MGLWGCGSKEVCCHFFNGKNFKVRFVDELLNRQEKSRRQGKKEEIFWSIVFK